MQTRHYNARLIFAIARLIFVNARLIFANARLIFVNAQPRDANAQPRDVISGCHRLLCQAGIISSMPLHETRAPLINRYLVLAIELLP